MRMLDKALLVLSIIGGILVVIATVVYTMEYIRYMGPCTIVLMVLLFVLGLVATIRGYFEGDVR